MAFPTPVEIVCCFFLCVLVAGKGLVVGSGFGALGSLILPSSTWQERLSFSLLAEAKRQLAFRTRVAGSGSGFRLGFGVCQFHVAL